MPDQQSMRRLAENEAFFRGFNEQIQRGLDEINEIAREDGVQPLAFDENRQLHFYCECADEKCTAHIMITLTDYNNIHNDRTLFTIKPGHEVPEIEDVVDKTTRYTVVKKRTVPPSRVEKPHISNLHNA
jgi:hypothetical protein